ncbi:MAG: (2Fe-2S)-binding protein [Myxococcales bacterium]|nr:(2Fe-2S)-binding protein [Myxococcales bacterium]MCB9581235.1 (2Fe-2S)-binding protein [Polyangiaceae bacterium]
MIVCHCQKVSDRHVRLAVRGGARNVEEVGAACGAGTCCGGCRPALRELIAEEAPETVTVVDAPAPAKAPTAA